jgi:hypothetical protein
MKPAAIALALALAFAGAPAFAGSNINGHKCDVHSDWSVRTHRLAFVFAQEGHQPGEVGIGGGRLFIDGKEQQLSAADHARLSRMEAEMHAMLPQLQKVAVEAVDIAFSALVEVARGLASDPQRSVADLENARARLRRQMESRPLAALDGDAIGRTIGPILGEFIPQIVGGAVSNALSAAFGGEKKSQDFEKRMQRMEQELDAKVERRARELEPLADALCGHLQAMDKIDDELEYRLPDGGRLELLRVGSGDKD